MKHLFITSDGRLHPRWQEAFPEAGAVADFSRADLTPSTTMIWAREDHPRHADLLPELRDAGRPFVVISLLPRQDNALAALAAGARGYCHALAAPTMLRDVAAAVSHGGLWVGPELLNRLIRSLPPALTPFDPGASPHADLVLLTERERQTAEFVAQGLSNKEVARRLDITERTVKAHLSAIFTKLELRDRLQLALRFKRGA